MPTLKKKGKTARRDRPPTIIDVAREADVGIMSVSRVINNHPSVKPSTRAKVLKAIAKTGYFPNDAARMLKGRASRTIGLVVPDLSDFFASCFHAVQSVAASHNYQTLVVATGRSAAVEERQLESIQNHRVAGLLIVPSGNEGTRLQMLQQSGIQVVALDRPAPGIHADAILVENREGAELGVRHLIQHGHKKIACVGFDSGSYTVRERIEGYKAAMRASGLRPLLATGVNSYDAMHALVARWAAAPPPSKDRPTAAFTVKRIASIQLIRALHAHKMRVPSEIALVGFDDFELAEVLGTPLTAIRQDPTELARAATELLFKRIEAQHDNQPAELRTSKILFPAELVIRRSCGCPART
jgi:LacI family transcriptional regulator